MVDKCEELVHLYLRLNGFLTVPNYLLQNPTEWTDVDVLGVRFPHKQEKLGGEVLEDDNALQLAKDKLEVLLVEVGRSKTDFNESWRDIQRMRYVLRFLGLFEPRSGEIDKVSGNLAELKAFENDQLRIRPLLCSGHESIRDDLTHRRLDSVLDFIVQRFSKNQRYKRYRPQWSGTLADEICRLIKQRRSPRLREIGCL